MSCEEEKEPSQVLKDGMKTDTVSGRTFLQVV